MNTFINIIYFMVFAISYKLIWNLKILKFIK